MQNQSKQIPTSIGEEPLFKYGIILNGNKYPLGPFGSSSEAEKFLEDLGFIKVIGENFIFSPNKEYESQYAQVIYVPNFIPPDKIKERMRKKNQKHLFQI